MVKQYQATYKRKTIIVAAHTYYGAQQKAAQLFRTNPLNVVISDL